MMRVQKLIAVVSSLLFITCCDYIRDCPDDMEITESWPAMPEAIDALDNDTAVTVKTIKVESWKEGSDYYYFFKPNSDNKTTAFIIYPGGLVDLRAYAPTARAIAEAGYSTFLIKMPGDLAPFGAERAKTIIDSEVYSGIEMWVLGGHSVGGSFACAYAKNNTGTLDGVVLWASFPSDGFRLDATNLKAISIYGDKDGHPDSIEAGAEHLPAGTPFVKIEGGNHTQFAYYDTSPCPQQPGDGEAEISREEQQSQIIDATVNFLEGF